ncbi:MAG: hypothetical protein K1X53_00880 [Candidatus Sumerlaeaceae bacterium]|nr:hypothetical protein [Candidatus Sumerlaeaceae bacterium]
MATGRRILTVVLTFVLMLASDVKLHCEPTGFKRAIEPWAWKFPKDHGQHPGFQTEWWYFTGNLRSESKRDFGYQFTIFRRSLTDKPMDRASAWATPDVYLCHLAVTDISGGRFMHSEVARRPALGLAGASTETLNVWVGANVVRMDDSTNIKLQGSGDGFRFELYLHPKKDPILNGPGGVDKKGPEPGDASYYYSMTRLETTGTLFVGEEEAVVHGTSWMDHEFGSNQLPKNVQGWDWFSIQLSDSTELMIYQLRLKQGGAARESGGTVVNSDGTSEWLQRGDFVLEPLKTWKSPATGAVYPAGWKLGIPSRKLELKVTPRVADQELHSAGTTGVSYWEGAIEVEGNSGDRKLSGSGYGELTGYVEGMSGRL